MSMETTNAAWEAGSDAARIKILNWIRSQSKTLDPSVRLEELENYLSSSWLTIGKRD